MFGGFCPRETVMRGIINRERKRDRDTYCKDDTSQNVEQQIQY